jgi:hypothetical protein
LTINEISSKIALPDNSDKVQHQFVLQQWRVIEEMLVERCVHDTGITAVNQGNGLDDNMWSSDTKNIARSSDTKNKACSSDTNNGVIFSGLAIFFALFIGGVLRIVFNHPLLIR